MDNLAKEFGAAVKHKRKAAGFSQEEFAAACEIDRSYMSRIERGVCQITLIKVYVIARTLNIEVPELLPSIRQIRD